MKPFDEAYCIETFRRLLAVDSTTGQYEEIQQLLCGILKEQGWPYHGPVQGHYLEPQLSENKR